VSAPCHGHRRERVVPRHHDLPQARRRQLLQHPRRLRLELVLHHKEAGKREAGLHLGAGRSKQGVQGSCRGREGTVGAREYAVAVQGQGLQLGLEVDGHRRGEAPLFDAAGGEQRGGAV
jgi:hypothetical protein